MLLATRPMVAPVIALLSGAVFLQAQPKTPLVIPGAVAQVVLVDAHVTDARGRPIADLRISDFELFEDDERVPITSFRPPGSSVAPPITADGAAVMTSEAEPTGREPLTVAIYVDRFQLSPSGRKRALDQASALAAAHIAQGARVIVIGDDPELRALTPLLSDAGAVSAVLGRIQGWVTSSPGVGEGRQTLDSMRLRIEAASERECPGVPPCVCVLPDLIGMGRNYAVARVADAKNAADRLAFLVTALGTLPGRKALIYVSEGLEQRPGIHIYDQIGTFCPEALQKEFGTITAAMQEFETSPALHDAAARANAARVSFYPIDARGLTGLSSADVTEMRREYTPTAKNDSIRDANLANPLQLLAEETGGFALLRGLGSDVAMKRFDADAGGHYVLGFVPGDPDGRTHSLRLRLTAAAQAKHKTDIRHRQSYFRGLSRDRRGQRALATLVFGLEENGLEIEAEVERLDAKTARIRAVLLLSSLTPVPGREEATVKVVLSYRKENDPKSPPVVREKDLTFAMSAAERDREGGLREIIVDVPIDASGYRFVVAVEDMTSSRASYLKRSVGAQDAPSGSKEGRYP